MAIKALMVDVDGVLVDGRPEDGLHWATSLEADLGFTAGALHEHFFVPHWEDIIVGRGDMMRSLAAALKTVAPHVTATQLRDYWFANDARLVKKPDEEFFAKVQMAVGLAGHELLLVDDSRANVDAALRAGWHAVHWTTHGPRTFADVVLAMQTATFRQAYIRECTSATS